VIPVDERFSSKMAKAAMLEMGMKKKQRREKENVDVIAATLLLQEYLRSIV
ncbi:MAG: Holliday junction resolvase RuvX, partial [Bacteroidota bacterium]